MDPLSIIASTIGIMQGVASTYGTIKNIAELPDTFNKVSDKFPLVERILKKAVGKILQSSPADDDQRKAILAIVEPCKTKADELKRIFEDLERKCTQDKDSKSWNKVRLWYREALRGIKAHRVESLMNDILNGVELLALDQFFELALKEDIDEVKKAIEELAKVDPSLDDSEFDTAGVIYASQSNAEGAFGQLNNIQGGQSTFMSGNNFTGSGNTNYFGDILGDVNNNNCPPDLIRQVETMSQRFEGISTDMHENRARKRSKDRQAILSWINSFNYGSIQSDHLARRHEGTGEWLLGSKQFKRWLVGDDQTILCSGDPGTGKTVLTAIIVDDLRARFRNDPTTGIAVIYCEHKRRKEQGLEHFLSSLLKGLAQQQACLPKAVVSLYEQHKENRTRPLSSELSATLLAVAGLYSRVYIMVDALDECDGSCRAKLVAGLLSLQILKHVSIFATARPNLQDIKESFRGSVHLEIQSPDSDLRKYIDGRLFELPGWVKNKDGLQQEIGVSITKSAGGIFLLAKLHFDSLLGSKSLKALRVTLKELPTGSEALNTMYRQAMDRVRNQVSNEKELAMQVLAWITCAERPLSTSEIQHALGVEIGEKYLDEDNITPIDHMVSVCAGLVTIDSQSDIIRLYHHTTYAYLDKTQVEWFSAAEAEIAETCITYLSFAAFEAGVCSTDEEFEARLSSSQLYGYAAKNWGHHARKACRLVPGVLSFLTDDSLVQASIQAIWADGDDGIGMEYSQAFPKATTGLHLAARFGSIEAVDALLRNETNPDPRDSYQRTPLWLAACEGHDSVVGMLIGTGKVDVNARNTGRYTPLHIAGMNGHGPVVKLLLRTGRAIVGTKSRTGQSALSAAASMGHTSLVQQLLQTGMFDVNKQSRSRSTPLSLAAEHGHLDVVKLLLSISQIQVDQSTKCGRTPFSWAVGNGHESISKVLIATNVVDVNSRDSNYGRTPLSWAAESGHINTVRMLLRMSNVDVDSKDTECGRTPLSRAAESGHDAVVEALLDTGKVDVNSRSQAKDTLNPQFNIEGGRTPVSWAAEKGHDGVVKLLLGRGADASLESASRRTPRTWAIQNGYGGVADLLDI